MTSQSILRLRSQSSRILPARQCTIRAYSSKDNIPPPSPPKGPTEDGLPTVSEEAAATAKFTNQSAPDLSQGTPVEEVVKRDPEALRKAPHVIKDTPGSKRQYSTEAAQKPEGAVSPAILNALRPVPKGAKFPLPDLPLPSTANLHRRYSPILDMVTNLIMKDGKKAFAQSTMTKVMTILRTKPAPTENLRTPIISTAPPLASLPSDPVAYIQTAIDSVAPLLRIKMVKGSGGFRDAMPIPLGLKQRRRKAVVWILEAADKKKDRLTLAERIAEEIVSVIEGRSTAWDKRQMVHKTAVSARANVKVKIL